MNAVEYVVLPGAVNKETRRRVLEEIERCDCPHFLVLFRDSKLQFRALYAFYPDTEEVSQSVSQSVSQIDHQSVSRQSSCPSPQIASQIANVYRHFTEGRQGLALFALFIECKIKLCF